MVGTFCLAYAVIINKKFNPATQQSANSYNGNKIIGDCIILVYITVLLLIFITSLGVKPTRIPDFYKILSVVLGTFQFYIIYLTISFLTDTAIQDEKEVVIAVGGTIASFTLVVILNCEI